MESHIGNDVLEALGKRVSRLAVGGLPDDYNEAISLEGVEAIQGPLSHVRFEYCTKVGDMAIKEIGCRFSGTLVEVAVIRNFYEKVAKISDESIKSLQKCKKLKTLELVHTRRFDDNLALYLSQGFEALRVLNLTHCPVHVSLEPLAEACPRLEELNLSGDSWVKRQALLGIAKHPHLLVLRLGHFEHSDFKCADAISEHPPKAFFIVGLFQRPDYFPKLTTLYLELACNLTSLIKELVQEARSGLRIEMTPNTLEIGDAIVIDEEEDVDHGQRYGIYEDDDDIDFRYF